MTTGARAVMFGWLVALLGGCMDPADDPGLKTYDDAINYRNVAAVERLARTGRSVEERNELGATPLISAASSDQFRIAQILVDAGADVFASDRFGVTVGEMVWNSKVKPGSPEGKAREELIAVLRARGFPLPPPSRKQVLELVKAGAWPPRQGT